MTARLSKEIVEFEKSKFKLRDIKMLSEFKGIHAKTQFRCLTEGHVWTTTFNSVRVGHGCSKCAGLSFDDKMLKARLVEFEKRNIRMLDRYINSRSKYKFECLKSNCGHTWSAKFNDVSTGTGCPKCALGVRLTNDHIEKIKAEFRSRHIEMQDVFIGVAYKHNFRCLKLNCNHIWKAKFCNVYHDGTSCPKCSGHYKTSKERDNAKAHLIIRNRLATMFYKGTTPTKVYRDEYGNHNELWNELIPHWYKEYNNFLLCNPKPTDENVYHLDHIIPVIKFDPYNLEHLKLCWCQNNLQWLSAKENSIKNAKLMPHYFTDWHYKTLDKIGIVL